MIDSQAIVPVLAPSWPVPSGVKSLITCAHGVGGENVNGYGRFNLAQHVGDDAAKVAICREQLARQVGVASWQWLNQVHGTEVVRATDSGVTPNADACFTSDKQLACAVLTADCLPVLLCNTQGTQVAAAHAGWRGLAAGMLEATCNTFACGDELMAYLGPAIGPSVFEVGAEVKTAFERELGLDASNCFKSNQKNPHHYFADLYALAQIRLERLGIQKIYGGGDCTFTDSRFYSYRRQNVTGRFASIIWIEG